MQRWTTRSYDGAHRRTRSVCWVPSIPIMGSQPKGAPQPADSSSVGSIHRSLSTIANASQGGFLAKPTWMKHRQIFSSGDSRNEHEGGLAQRHDVAQDSNLLRWKISQIMDEAGFFKDEASGSGPLNQKLNLKIGKWDLEINEQKGKIAELKGKTKTAESFFAVLESASDSNNLLQEKLDHPDTR
jgi:hypothetical protein